MNIEYWAASISNANHPESALNGSHLDCDNPHIINVTLTMTTPQSIPSLEESYKVITLSTLNFHLSYCFQGTTYLASLPAAKPAGQEGSSLCL
jgi:hypothetical protein